MRALSPRDLDLAFATWLLREPNLVSELQPVVKAAAAREGADQDFENTALLGFAAGSGILGEQQLLVLGKGLRRLAGRSPMVNGSHMTFCGDAVGLLGVVVGTKTLADKQVAAQIEDWASRFFKDSHANAGNEEWQQCLIAAAGRTLSKSLALELPHTPATADVRLALAAHSLIPLPEDLAVQDLRETLQMAEQELPEDFPYDRAALRLAAVEWVMRTATPADQDVPLAQTDGPIEWIDSEAGRAGRPFEPVATEERIESTQRAETDRRTGIFGTAGQPKARPTGGGFAANPQIRKLVEENPAALPLVNLAARFEQAKAEGEVAFRQSELKGNWAEWSGVFPWEGERDPDTTDCPWWVAGAEYVFHLTAVWRKYSPGEPEKIEAVLPKQIELSAKWVYHAKVRLHDIMRGKSSNAEHILIGHEGRFFNIAFLFSMQKFAEIDLDEWRDHAAKLAGTITDLKSASTDQSAPQPAPGVSPRAQAKKPGRRNQKYKAIDRALQEIAESRPRTQADVFKALEGRVGYPPAEPFESARGWMAGFGRDPRAARAWLSKRWAELDLPAFARGPKKRK
jgi:hypothetical protein